MFGYVKPDAPYLYIKDDTLYKSLYCSVCKAIGKNCGQRARLSLTYDIAFMSALLHNVAGKDVKIERKRCVVHPFMPRPIASGDEITDLCAYINVALAYYKIEDDITDGNGGKLKKLIVAKGNRKVKRLYPEINRVITERYAELRELEKKECASVDEIAEPFAQMMVELGNIALSGKEYKGVRQLLYFLGKWIYLIDALDDYEKDIKEKNYNPLYYAYGRQPDFKTLLKKYGSDISFAFSTVFAGMKEAYNECVFKFDSALIQNIILRGIPAVTLKTFKKEDKKIKKDEKKKNGK